MEFFLEALHLVQVFGGHALVLLEFVAELLHLVVLRLDLHQDGLREQLGLGLLLVLPLEVGVHQQVVHHGLRRGRGARHRCFFIENAVRWSIASLVVRVDDDTGHLMPDFIVVRGGVGRAWQALVDGGGGAAVLLGLLPDRGEQGVQHHGYRVLSAGELLGTRADILVCCGIALVCSRLDGLLLIGGRAGDGNGALALHGAVHLLILFRVCKCIGLGA